MGSKLLPICIVCGETPTLGIMDGVVLRGKFLCSACEHNILSLEVASPDYEAVVQKLKGLWAGKL